MFVKIIAFLTTVLVFLAELLGLPADKLKYEFYENLSYGTHERHVLDLVVPKTAKETGLILYIHGGAWMSGDKSVYRESLEAMAKKHGVACAALNYRYISDDINLLDIMDDIDAAMLCIKETGKKHGVDINRSILTGGSAGGHLSLLYAYSRADSSAIPPVAVMSDCGPTDLSDEYYFYNEDIDKITSFGSYEVVEEILTWACGEAVVYEDLDKSAQALAAVSPMTYVDENTVPTIINHGILDDTVPFRNAQALDARLTQLNIEHVFNIYPNSGHGLERDPDSAQRAQALFDEYIIKYVA